jgi:hypothetical protein
MIAVALTVAGCAGPAPRQAPRPDRPVAPVRFESSELRVTLLRIMSAGSQGTLVQDEGWREYVLEIGNLGTRPVTVRNVKLLNLEGRYVDSAVSYNELTAPPDPAYKVAGDVAASAARTAAGQIIPYGGYIVTVFSGVASASAAGDVASAKRSFALRKLKDVELAPGGRVEGSAFLPNIGDAKALVLDFGNGQGDQRIEIALPR